MGLRARSDTSANMMKRMGGMGSYEITLGKKLWGTHGMLVCEREERELTVTDGAQRVIVVQALAHDSPLGEDGIGADSVFIKVAPGAH